MTPDDPDHKDPEPPSPEPSNPEPRDPAPVPPPPRRGGGGWLLLLLLLVGGAAGWYYGYPWAKQQYEAYQAGRELLPRLESELASLKRQLQASDQGRVETGSRLERTEQRVADLARALDGGRTVLQLAAVEQLLLLANDHLLLTNDAGTASRALAEADRRLSRFEDPRLIPVREALARERAALARMPSTDRTGPALALGELIRQAPGWPLRARSPERYQPEASDEPAAGEAKGMQRLWNAVTRALAGMFTVRRNQGPAPRLLPPGEEALVMQALSLKLEGARLAVLAGDHAAMHELCESAGDWLRMYYNTSHPDVVAARRQLEELTQVAVSTFRPDISGSLSALRQIMGERSEP